MGWAGVGTASAGAPPPPPPPPPPPLHLSCLGVGGQQAVLDGLHPHKPGWHRFVDERRVRAPAVWVGMHDRGGVDQAPRRLDRRHDRLVRVLDKDAGVLGHGRREPAVGVHRAGQLVAGGGVAHAGGRAHARVVLTERGRAVHHARARVGGDIRVGQNAEGALGRARGRLKVGEVGEERLVRLPSQACPCDRAQHFEQQVPAGGSGRGRRFAGLAVGIGGGGCRLAILAAGGGTLALGGAPLFAGLFGDRTGQGRQPALRHDVDFAACRVPGAHVDKVGVHAEGQVGRQRPAGVVQGGVGGQAGRAARGPSWAPPSLALHLHPTSTSLPHQGVVVQATRAPPSGSPSSGKATMTAGSGTSL